MKVLRAPYVYKSFKVLADTSVITVGFLLWNQWYAQGGPCARIVQVDNITKGTNVNRNEMPGANAQTYPTLWNFNIDCDADDIIQVKFISPDPGRATQYVRVTNVTIDTSGTGV